METTGTRYDWIVIGSGFGGSVSALRLAEKGYRVLVIEKGRRFAPADFAKTNMELSRWLWAPAAGLRGIYQMTFMRHVTILHGVGVGGGSLVYANTLPRPKRPFFQSKTWAHLGDWEKELAPHYDKALEMLGATRYPGETEADRILKQIAEDIGRPEHHHPTDVAVFFGKPGVEVDDPYFGGKGPRRVGCTECGACMTGCRVGRQEHPRQELPLPGRTTRRRGARRDRGPGGPAADRGGYRVETRGSLDKKQKRVFQGDARGLRRRRDGHDPAPPRHARRPERLAAPVASRGTLGAHQQRVADGGLQPEDAPRLLARRRHHVHPAHRRGQPHRAGPLRRRLQLLPQAGLPALDEDHPPRASGGAWRRPTRSTRSSGRARFIVGENRKTAILLYMRTLDESLTLKLKRMPLGGRILDTEIDDPQSAPRANLPEAADLAQRFAEKMGGVVSSLFSETLLGTPTTAHILGGACMGKDASEGVIDAEHRVFGYPGLYVIDGSAVSANPGVNPSLTITALAERAMSRIPLASELGKSSVRSEEAPRRAALRQ